MTLGEMTDADKVMNPQHFESDPVHIRIRMQISLEIWPHQKLSEIRIQISRVVCIRNSDPDVCRIALKIQPPTLIGVGNE